MFCCRPVVQKRIPKKPSQVLQLKQLPVSSNDTTYITGPSRDTTYSARLSDTAAYSGRITGWIASAADNRSISGVTIVVTGNQEGNTGASRSVVTDSNGYYEFANLVLGDYLLTVQPLAGYSGKRGQVRVVVPAGHSAIGTDDLIVNVEKSFELLPLKANANGKVYVEKEKVLARSLGNRFTASAAIVQVYVKGEIPDRYTDTSDANGTFAFSNLPATALRNISAEIVYLPYTDNDGTRFASVTDTVLLTEGNNTLETAYMMTYQEPFVLLKSNVKGLAENSVALNTSILIIMSSVVDPTRLTNIMLKEGWAAHMPVSTTARQDSVIVTPSLMLTAGASYQLMYQLFSTDGRVSRADTLKFSTVKGIGIQSVSYYATDMSRVRLSVNDNIIINFTLAPVIDPLQTRIMLSDAAGLIQTTVSASGNSLTIQPNFNLMPNTKYTVAISDLRSVVIGDNFSWTDTLLTRFTNAPVSSVSGLVLEDPGFKANYNTLSIPVKWNRSNDAAFYNIYVKNSAHPAWLLLSANSYVGDNFSNIQRHAVSLNALNLDMIINGAAIEPFGLGAICSLKVVPVNIDSIEGAVSTQAVFGISDLVQPEIVSNPLFISKTDANINNVSGAPVTLDFTVEFTEYVKASGTPTQAIIGGGFPSVSFSNWNWGATEGASGKNSATFRMTIPSGVNLDTKEIYLSNLQDQSGNSISAGVTIRLTDN